MKMKMKMKICKHKACVRKSSTKGYCPVHYERFKRHGNSSIKYLTYKERKPSEIHAIRSAVGSLREIGKQYGISHEAVRSIKSGKTWGHIK